MESTSVEKKPFRILSLSGGGVRGIYQAVFLKNIAFHLPSPIRSNFDLIAGTSTGAILAAALACEVDLAHIETFFKEEAPKIFKRRALSWLRKGPHYDKAKLATALRRVFGERKLRECKTDVLIPVTMLDNFTPLYFTSYQGLGFENTNLDKNLVDVLLASAAAPTYFAPTNVGNQPQTYVDGGLWANSPSLIAVTTAHGLMHVSFESMRVLSIGNGRSAKGELGTEFRNLRPYGRRMIASVMEMMFETQAHFANFGASELVGKSNGKSHFFEVNDETPNGVIHLDDVENAITRLPALAAGRSGTTWAEIKEFLSLDTSGGGGDKYSALSSKLAAAAKE